MYISQRPTVVTDSVNRFHKIDSLINSYLTLPLAAAVGAIGILRVCPCTVHHPGVFWEQSHQPLRHCAPALQVFGVVLHC